ncbi:site-specific integrase [Bradyrhizobium sp. SZCCHNRI2049]|uniref:tyrosine-type recombinase/integrase n=1 Tax=Bradyrhizobium sp. SZCCHNRI2049 TaxID=3057287 RepID=UPI002916ED4A|nr:site-specific integrase [Bradyrhizobium sp. SZCCHNRI2049]
MARKRVLPSGRVTWQADGTNPQGRRVRPSFNTEQKAKDYEKHVLTKDYGRLAIGRLFPSWYDELYSPSKSWRNALSLTNILIREFGGGTDIRDFRRSTIKEKREKWQKEDGLSNQAVNNRLSILSRYLNHAVDEEILNEDELPKITLYGNSRSRRFTWFTYEQEDALWAEFENEHTRRFATFLLHTGCRHSEAARLTWEDWSHNERRVRFWDTKTNDQRTVPLTDEAYEALTWAKQQGWETPWEGISYFPFLHEWQRCLARVMRKQPALRLTDKYVPYTCRHTCATRLARAKFPALKIAEWMGHSSLETTRRYIKFVGEDLDDGAAHLSRRARSA